MLLCAAWHACFCIGHCANKFISNLGRWTCSLIYWSYDPKMAALAVMIISKKVVSLQFILYSNILFINSLRNSIIASLLQKLSTVNDLAKFRRLSCKVCLTTISFCHLGCFSQILIKHISFACSFTYIYSSYFLCLRRKR